MNRRIRNRTYGSVGVNSWGEDETSIAVAIIAHTAYHL